MKWFLIRALYFVFSMGHKYRWTILHVHDSMPCVGPVRLNLDVFSWLCAGRLLYGFTFAFTHLYTSH